MKAITILTLPEHLLGQVTLVSHPFARHFITKYRDRESTGLQLRSAVDTLFYALMFKALETFHCTPCNVTTPMGEVYEGHRLSSNIIFSPIVRAGEGSYEPIFRIFPDAPVCHLELERIPDSLQIRERRNRLPPVIDPQTLVVFTDPAFATSHTAAHATASAKQRGARRIIFLCLFASIPGLVDFCAKHPDVSIYTCGLDPTLDENGYVRPGAGDSGDRYFNTQH